MKRGAVGLALLVLTLFPSVDARAQLSARVPRVGVLSPGTSTESPAVQREPFERGLRELGWVPGSTVVIEYRYAEGRSARLAELATELVKLKVDIIVARSNPAVHAARRATGSIPDRDVVRQRPGRGRPREEPGATGRKRDRYRQSGLGAGRQASRAAQGRDRRPDARRRARQRDAPPPGRGATRRCGPRSGSRDPRVQGARARGSRRDIRRDDAGARGGGLGRG